MPVLFFFLACFLQHVDSLFVQIVQLSKFVHSGVDSSEVGCYLPNRLFLHLDNSQYVKFVGRYLVRYIQGFLERLQLSLQYSGALLHFFDALPQIR